MKTRLTQDDLSSFKYFYQEKDVTRWCDWETKKHLFKEEFPEVIHQMEVHRIAKLGLDKLIRCMDTDYEEPEEVYEPAPISKPKPTGNLEWHNPSQCINCEPSLKDINND